jgi:hypothetical protein
MSDPKPRKPRAKRPGATPAKAAASAPISNLGQELLRSYRAPLVEERDYSVFNKIADSVAALPAGSQDLVGPALFELLRACVLELAPVDQAAAAQAIDAYAADVMERPDFVVRPGEDVAELAAEMGVMRWLEPETVDSFRRFGEAMAAAPAPVVAEAAPTPATPEPAPTAEAKPAAPADPFAAHARVEQAAPRDYTPEPPKAAQPEPKPEAASQIGAQTEAKAKESAPEPAATVQAPRAAATEDAVDDQMAAVGYEEIRRACLAARSRKRKVIIVVGLATTGKSFFVRRLFHSLRRRYTYSTLKGLPDTGDLTIDRTKEVLLYSFERIAKPRSPENFDIYDIPGDQFVKLVRRGFVVGGDDRETVKLIYAILAFADAIVFIAPALQVLKRDLFVSEGDDLALNPGERLERMKDIERFIQSLNPMTRVMALLREQMHARFSGNPFAKDRPKGEAGRAAAADQVIDDVLAMNFETLQRRLPKSPRLNMPAVLLLSRADELRARLERHRDSFDYDPTYQLLFRGREHLDNLAGRFDSFSADFLTAEDGHRPGEAFRARSDSYGAYGIMERWILPAIGACSRWRWMRWLEAPSIALAVRRRLDPRFDAAWKLDSGADA